MAVFARATNLYEYALKQSIDITKYVSAENLVVFHEELQKEFSPPRQKKEGGLLNNMQQECNNPETNR